MNVSTKGNQIKLKLMLHLFKDTLHRCWFLPDFSDRGKRRARKSWIRPQNTVFWDLDSLLKRSTQIERCVTATPFKHKPSVHEGNTILTVTHPQQVVLPGSVKRVLEKARAQTQLSNVTLEKYTNLLLLRRWGLFTDFQVETFSSTKEKILSHWSRGRQSSTSPSRRKGVVAEQIPTRREWNKTGKA